MLFNFDTFAKFGASCMTPAPGGQAGFNSTDKGADVAFLLFSGEDYYPNGGAEDFLGKYDSIDAAIDAHDPACYKFNGGWAHVFNLDTLKIVKCFRRGTWSDD